MNKSILSEYADACGLLKETEQDIQKLRKKRKMVTRESVKGSNPDFPYQEQNFHIEGTPFTYDEDERLRREEELLKERKARAEGIKLEVEAWMNTIPLRMQRIIRYKMFEKNSWEQAADRIGGGATAESIKKEFQRFLKKK